MCWTARSMGWPSKSITRTPLRSEHGDIAIGQEKNIARVVENRGDIAGDEIFVVAEADHSRRARARRDNLSSGRVRKESPARKRRELLHGFAHGLFERAAILSCTFPPDARRFPYLFP